jgi:riboflavin kinase / FMN adenylyltransferase
VNVGERPTFGGGRVTLEAHLVGFDGDLYDSRLRVAFHERLRGEQRFASADALVAQIRADVQAALARLPRPGGPAV